MLAGQYSLLIPTYNRPHHLRRMLDYFDAKRVSFAIHVMDGSTPENWEINRTICASVDLAIKHHHFPDDLPLGRVLALLDEIDTPYLSLCGDDDILVVESLPEMLTFLDENPDYVACHGQYFNFLEDENTGSGHPQMRLIQVEYIAPSLAAETALERISELMADYESPFYAVVRTAKMGELITSWLPQCETMFIELFQANGLAVLGKVERRMIPYLFRNSSVSFNESKHCEPFSWFAENAEELFRHYAEYRNQLVRMIKGVSDPGLPDAAIKQALDMAHYLYFSSALRNDLVYEGIQCALGLTEERWKTTLNSIKKRASRPARASGTFLSAHLVLTEGREWDFKIDKAVFDCLGSRNIVPLMEILAPYYPNKRDQS